MQTIPAEARAYADRFGQHGFVWMGTSDSPSGGPPLAGDVHADVCVVGAGIAGLTTAYLLARSGRSVVVLDDGPIAGGETSRTAAHLSHAIDDRYWWIEIVHGAAAEFARENANVAAQYGEYAAALVTAESDEGIAPGEGAVVRRGVHFVAAYRDGSGSLHECSAVCPHLGCLVAWNRLEKTWDWPCHGSRFDPEGCVVNGPAISGLAPEPVAVDRKRRPPKGDRPVRSV